MPTDHDHQCHISTLLKHLQGRRLHHPPVPMHHCSFWATWNFPLPERGKSGKQRRKNLARGVLVLQEKKNPPTRNLIKKVCLKTVHMPAPGYFKYLWCATYLIFRSTRDAAHRTWCECTLCLTRLWLVNHCSCQKEKADPRQGCEAHLAAGLMLFSLYPRSKVCNRARFSRKGTVSIPSYSVPGTHTAPSEVLLLQAERCKGDAVWDDSLRPTATSPRCVIPPLSQITKDCLASTTRPK